MLKFYVKAWVLVSVLLTFEFLMLNTFPEYGILGTLKHFGFFPHVSLNPTTGKSISLFFGWTGFGIMCLTNLYTIRKRIFFKSWGSLKGWLDFHIFCGLIGPTFILFHTNFKIGGLVAVSFWSMVISFLSGIVGRYFYLQITSQKSELEKLIMLQEKKLTAPMGQPSLVVQAAKQKALELACIPVAPGPIGLAGTLYYSVLGDIRMKLYFPQVTEELSEDARKNLEGLVFTTKKHVFLEQFRALMGYWHSFHMPFAIFMYLVATIHIATATLLAVGEVH